MNTILAKIFVAQDMRNTCKEILSICQNNWSCFVNFLYFANAMQFRLFEDEDQKKNSEYENFLVDSDILLPDWIALQIFYWLSCHVWIKSINGTDFLPFFLHYLQNKKSNFQLVLYGGTQEVIKKSQQYFEEKWISVVFAQDGFQEFNWQNLDKIKVDSVLIFLVARGTPLQETRVHNHVDKLKKYHGIVFTVGGLFDFLSWEEKRAPSWLVKIRIWETFWRIVTNPSKNLKKFLAMFGILRRWCQKIVKSVLKKKTN